MTQYAIGVDVGATNLRICVGDESGNINFKVKVPTPKTTRLPKVIVDLIRSNFRNTLKAVVGVCIGSIGPLDVNSGEIVSAPGLPFNRVKLVKPIAECLGLPVILLNDAVAAVWGERVYGEGRSVQNLAYVTLSTGIGVGVIVDGRLLKGKEGNAHEVGHVTVDYKGRLKCRCGGVGHWEAYASGSGIPGFTRYLASKHPSLLKHSTLRRKVETGTLTARAVLEAAKAGDPLAQKVVDELAIVNAAGFSTVINCYDPELITVGGPLALNHRETILEPMMGHLRKYAINRIPRITVTPLGEDVVLKGAIAAVFNPPSGWPIHGPE